MAFKLPKYEELTDEQRKVVNVPLNKNHLVTGAPGTGKSVIAVYMADEVSKAGMNILMLVHNRPLMSYMESAIVSLDVQAEVETFHAWLGKFYRKEIGVKPPDAGSKFSYRWNEIKERFKHIGIRYDHIIVDEAQDFPLDLIECLTLVSNTITCFMDENQSIFEGLSDWKDVADILDVRSPYRLHRNYRNPEGIFRFAKVFHPDGSVEADKRDKTKPAIIKCADFGHASPRHLTSKMVEVLNHNKELKTIGVFTNTQNQVPTYEELSECLKDRKVYMYRSKGRDNEFRDIDFDKPGVYVLTYHTVKGLEFDAVLMPTCENINSMKDDQLDDNLLYVAITRATKRLFLFYIREHGRDRYIDFFGKIKQHRDLLNWADNNSGDAEAFVDLPFN